MKLNWVRTVFSNGRHNLCVGNFVRWRGAYHVCFVDAHHHGALDGQLRVISSTDLETWDTCVAMAATSFDPQLLPLGDRMLIYGVQGDWEGDDFAGFPSRQVVAETRDLKTWTEPRRCFVANHDFWTPIELDGRYYLTCDDCGHVPEGMSGTVDLLTSTDGEQLALGVRGGARLRGVLAYPQRDGAVPASRRAPARGGADQAAARRAGDGPAALRGVGAHDRPARAAGRCPGAGRRSRGHRRPGGRRERRAPDRRFRVPGRGVGARACVLPSGRDTGYSGLYAVSGNEVLIAYYSGHEYPDSDERVTHGPCDIYLASVSL